MQIFFTPTTKTLIRMRGCADLSLRCTHMSEGSFSDVAVQMILCLLVV